MAVIKTKTFESNWMTHRLATKGDLVAGAELFQVDTVRYSEGTLRTRNPETYATKIKLDDPAIRNGVIYFHAVDPAWECQCFVAIEDFLNPDGDFVIIVPDETRQLAS